MIRRLVIGALLLSAVCQATVSAQAPPADLGHATLEELMNIRITTAGRREQRVADAAAAVFVITREDIRRSGLTSVPELLRLAPGVQVARINGSKWAISVRGFNGLYSNKLLVLIDGRSVYNRLYSGVLWDTEDLVLDDIDRIEVVRGPGAVDWGANAVNGVINIVTRSAADTRGGLVRAGAGTLDRGQVTVRYGGALGKTAYRVYTRMSRDGQTELTGGGPADDAWRRVAAGFRTDRATDVTTMTVESSVTRGSANALWLTTPSPTARQSDPGSTMTAGSLLARWTRRQASGATLQVVSFFDAAQRDEPVGAYWRRAGDVDVQYHAGIARHDVVLGGGYRVNHDRFAGEGGYGLTPESATESLAGVFAQDQIALVRDRLDVTVGARMAHDGLAGWNFQPDARLMWHLAPGHRVWTAASRAVRTPSLQDRGLRAEIPEESDTAPLPVRLAISGNPDLGNEEFSDVEAGYRAEVTSAVTLAVSAFAGRYRALRTSEPGAPVLALAETGPYLSVPVAFANYAGATTHGIEVDAQWTPAPWWRLDGSVTGFHLTPRVDARSADASAAVFDGDAPARQWQLHSGFTIGRGTIDGRVFHVGRLGNLGVDAYTRVDARTELPLTKALSVAFSGQNLLAARHAEFSGSSAELTATLLPRTARVLFTWRY